MSVELPSHVHVEMGLIARLCLKLKLPSPLRLHRILYLYSILVIVLGGGGKEGCLRVLPLHLRLVHCRIFCIYGYAHSGAFCTTHCPLTHAQTWYSMCSHFFFINREKGSDKHGGEIMMT